MGGDECLPCLVDVLLKQRKFKEAIEPLTEEQYRELQKLGNFDTKTQSWLKTPPEITKLGGAIFGDRRFGHVFVYHNTAPCFYRGRGFRGSLKI